MDQTWIDKLKTYAVEVGLKKIAPVITANLFSAFAALWAVHANALESWGVNYTPDYNAAWIAAHPITGHVILLELDTVSASAWALVGALIVGLWATGQHHVVAALPKTGGPGAA